MSDQQPDEGTETPKTATLPLEDAVRALNAMSRYVRAQQRKGGDRALLDRLERQSARRRAALETEAGDE